MEKLRAVLIFYIYIQACWSDQDLAPSRRNAIPPCLWCPKKTTTHRTTTHSTIHTTTPPTTAHTNHTTMPHTTAHTNHTTMPHTTAHTNHTTMPHTTAHTNHTTMPHTTGHTNHTTIPHTTAHTNHTSTPHPTAHTNHTSTPHPTAHTNHTSTPHPTAHTNHTSTPHPTAHTNHTSTPHPTAHTNHTSTPHPTAHTNHTSTPHPTAHTNHTSTPHPTAHTNQTSIPVTTMPPPTDYFVNGTAGTVCLRITASFKISYNDTKKSEIVNLPEPNTEASGNCSAEKAWLTLTFPQGQVTITFSQDTKDNNFFLSEVNITLKSLEPEKFGNSSVKAMVTPLKRSFSCEKVNIQVTSNVSLSVMNVKAQAFDLHDGNYGKEMKCSDGYRNMTVPIVVGIVLVVLILIVVIAYIVARQRSHRGYQSL